MPNTKTTQTNKQKNYNNLLEIVESINKLLDTTGPHVYKTRKTHTQSPGVYLFRNIGM